MSGRGQVSMVIDRQGGLTALSFAVGLIAAGVLFTVSANARPAPQRPPYGFFTASFQPWDKGDVHLLRPAVAQAVDADTPVGSLMTAGWRLIWDGSTITPGEPIVRFVLAVAPKSPQTRASEYLQIGRSRRPAAVRGCLAYGLKGGASVRRRTRMINGRRFAVWTNQDAGMSQQIRATDLRVVVDGVCYAIDRFSYGDTASAPVPRLMLSATKGAELLDAALESIQIGRLKPDQILEPAPLKGPSGAVARP